MSVLVTGAGGFLGKAICHALASSGKDVIALSRTVQQYAEPGIRPLQLDILNPRGLAGILARESCEAIFHFAAHLPTPSSTATMAAIMEVNVLGTAHMLDVFHQSGAEVFVYASSLPLIGKPTVLPVREDHPVVPETPYHVSKYAGELCALEYARRTKRRVVAFRISSPYGAGMKENAVLPLFLSRAMRGESIELHGSGSRVQNFVHARDVAGACVAALNRGSGCYNLAGCESISMANLAALAMRVGGRGDGSIRFSGRPDPQEDYRWDIDISRLAGDLHFVPEVSLHEGCAELYDSMKKGRKELQ